MGALLLNKRKLFVNTHCACGASSMWSDTVGWRSLIIGRESTQLDQYAATHVLVADRNPNPTNRSGKLAIFELTGHPRCPSRNTDTATLCCVWRQSTRPKWVDCPQEKVRAGRCTEQPYLWPYLHLDCDAVCGNSRAL